MATALITGATSGIGRAIALGLAEAGHDVYALGRNRQALEDIRATGPRITPLCADVTDRDAMEAVVADLPIDILVNNAGIMPRLGNFADMAMVDIDAALEINVSAAIALTRLVVPQMRQRGQGHVLFTGSAAAHSAVPNMAVYSATKAALSGFAAGLRADLSPHGIRVTEIVSGRVETGLYKDILDPDARAAMYADRRAIQPDDVARLVVAVVALPDWANVTRFDIMPTRPAPPSGAR